MNLSHQSCREAGEHICQQPSDQECIEPGCENPAGTWWGPLWCPPCDQGRLDGISAQFEALRGAIR